MFTQFLLKLKQFQLHIIVFVAGATVMIFELAGSRILAPYFGTSMFIWTSLIGVILGSLSIGYWLGGNLSDKNPTINMLAKILFISAIMIFFVAIFKDIVLILLQYTTLDIRLSSAIAAIILFAPPSVLLGMISPYAAKLKIDNLQNSGKTVGNLYALSTVGSIAGTFFAGFFLIPLIGSTNILFTLSGILTILSIFSSWSWTMNKFKTLMLFTVIPASIASNFLALDNIIDVETQYNRVLIFEGEHANNGHLVKYMQINNEGSSAMYVDRDDLVYEYTKYYDLAHHFTPKIERALIFGGAGYSYPKYFINTRATATIDVVEIDPGVTKLAREHFDLKDDPRLQIFHEDGRTFLNKNSKSYDAIFVDAFNSTSPPVQLTTVEAVTKMFNSLDEKGVIIANIISSIEGESSKFLQAEYATFSHVFPQVYLFYVRNDINKLQSQNIMLVALKTEEIPSFESKYDNIHTYLSHKFELPYLKLPILTDDHAPVEHYMSFIF